MRLSRIVRFAFWAVPFAAAVGVGIWSHSLMGILWATITFFGLQLLVFAPLTKVTEDYEEKHPPKSQIEVPDELLQQIMFVAEVKNMLPLSHRGYLNRPKLYVQGRALHGGENVYAAGATKLAKKLEFIEKTDGSIKLLKYNPGDWESLVASVYAQAQDVQKAMQENDNEEHLRALNWETKPLVPASTAATTKSKPESRVSKTEILEEMCQLDAMLRISLLGASGLTHAEANIIKRKVNPLFRSPFGSRVFPVTEETDEKEINKWLNHPLVNVLLPDTFVMNMAAQTPIPAVTMERILRKLLQDDYDMYWKIAEERVKSKK